MQVKFTVSPNTWCGAANEDGRVRALKTLREEATAIRGVKAEGCGESDAPHNPHVADVTDTSLYHVANVAGTSLLQISLLCYKCH